MSGLLDSALLTAVMDAAVRGTFILLAALAATALMRRTSAAARHLVWLAALTALLLLPIARGFVPEWRVLPAAPVFTATETPAPAAGPIAAPSASPASPASPASTAVPVDARTPARTAEASQPIRLPVDWKTLAVLAWAAGAAMLALRLAYGLARVRWIERRAVELTDDGWVRLTDGLARRLGLGRIVRLLREPGATVPMTWGIFRPVILLPGEADGWDDERRRVVLAHELAHVRRWDALTQWVAHLALAVYWFNPLVWVAVRRLREEREHACDDAVLEIGTRPAEYADHLLNIVRSLGSSQGTATAALAMARRSQFEGRLLAILDNAVRRNGVSRAAGLATAAAALACLLPLAAMRPAERAAVSTAATRAEATELAGSTGSHAVTDADAGKPVQRIAGKADALVRPGPGSLAEAVNALAADRDTLAAARAALAARLSALDSRAAVARAAAGEPDAVATPVLLRALEEQGDPGLYAEVIRASLQIESASERRLVLFRVLEQPDASAGNVAAVIGATRTMSSDTERRLVMTRAMEHGAFSASGGIVATMTESLRGMSSDTERRLVIVSLMERARLDTRSLASVLRLVPDFSSDTERRLVLTVIAERQRVEGAARDAYLAAARSIGSETDRALAIAALVGPAGTGTPATTAASRSGREPARGEHVRNRSDEYVDSHDTRRRTVRIRLRDAITGRDAWDLRGFRTGGSLRIEERVGGDARLVEAVCDGAGNPVWSYSVNGERREFDAAARRWMDGLLREYPG